MLHGQAPLHLGLGSNQIRQAFDLNEIKLAVLECPARELTFYGKTQPGNFAQALKQALNNGAAAMNLQFGAVFTGERCGAREK